MLGDEIAGMPSRAETARAIEDLVAKLDGDALVCPWTTTDIEEITACEFVRWGNGHFLRNRGVPARWDGIRFRNTSTPRCGVDG